MHQSVRDNFIDFTVKFEGRVTWMYLDVKGLVTIGIGNLIDPVKTATGLKFVQKKGKKAATVEEITAEWEAVKANKDLAKKGHLAAEKVTALELPAAEVDKLVLAMLDSNAKHLAKSFPDFEKMPADAQLAILSMAWAMGAGLPQTFPHFSKAVKNADWNEAAKQCTLQEKGNPGVKPRNEANRLLLANAAAVAANPKSDVKKLWWPEKAK